MRVYDCRSVADDPDEECASIEEIQESTKFIKADTYTMNKFIDLKEFDKSPVKNVLKTYPFEILPDK